MNRRLQWDIFCKVIDNFGDIGVSWRLAADLAARGHAVRLWVDDASALDWMAPGGCPGVRVLPWASPLDLAAAALAQQPADVMVEAFGCDVPAEFLAASAAHHRAGGQKPAWVNLEYLSAEAYVARCHGLPSPVRTGPAAGWTKWFFYPGFTASTGGLLRERGLPARQAAFGPTDRAAWLAGHGIVWQGEKLVSLFCYEPPALAALLAQLDSEGLEGQPARLLVTAGRASRAVKAILQGVASARDGTPSRLSVSFLNWLTQPAFDELLWACDLNFVRGEDSLARALWAGQPFVWHIYPQHDQAHLTKLQALMDWLEAPASLRAFHAGWNAAAAPAAAAPGLPPTLQPWHAATRAGRDRLLAQDDLATRLLGWVAKNR